MAIQSLILKNRKLATWFMSVTKAYFWEKQGEKKALKRFQEVAQRVPAYKKFIQKHNIRPQQIQTIKDFKKLPILNRENYLKKYSLEELCLDGKLSDKYLIDRSSGYSGASFFWPRLSEEDKDYPLYMKLAYEQFYGIDKKSSLMIITLSLGTWIGGEKISWATREISISKKNPFTVITPGPRIDEILEIVQYFNNKYEQLIIVGYPPFIKAVIDEGEKRGIDWKKIKPKIGLGGEGYSEDWREYIREKIGLPKTDFMGIAGGYGAADLGMSVGREYPISVLIRKLANRDRKLAQDLFGEPSIPSLCQYNPATFYIEEINKELIFTAKPGIPIVRYNIHDRGGVIPFEEIIKITQSHGYKIIELLKEVGYTKRDVWRLPFFYVYGRSNGTISIDGANVYPENLESVLYTDMGGKINSLKLKKEIDKNFNERFLVLVELKKGEDLHNNIVIDSLKKKLHAILLQKLIELNRDYRESYLHNPQSCDPQIKIYSYRSGPFIHDGGSIKLKYILNGT